MKIAFCILFFLFVAGSVSAQKKQFKKDALTEILCLAENADQFVGKPDTCFIHSTRPAFLPGGDKWDITYVDTDYNKNVDSVHTIIIGTGHGAITLFVNNKSSLVTMLWFLAHKDAQLKEEDVIATLQGKFNLNLNGFPTTIEVNRKHFFLSYSPTGILIVNNPILNKN